MTFHSVIQHFFDNHAKSFSHKALFSNWASEVLEASDQTVKRVDLCTGTTIHNVFDDLTDNMVDRGCDYHRELYDTHWFLQVVLAGSEHHAEKVLLIERVKCFAPDIYGPHAAIPVPSDHITALGGSYHFPEPMACVCVLTHGSHGSDVVYEMEVEETLEFGERGMSLHELVAVLRSHNEIHNVDQAHCQNISKHFAVGSIDDLARRDARRHSHRR